MKKLQIIMFMNIFACLLIHLAISPIYGRMSVNDSVMIDIEGTWALDTAIVIQASENGTFADTSIYLLGDTVTSLSKSQPPQKIIITPNRVSFEYSSPLLCKSLIEHCRSGEYAFDGHKLRICFTFYEEYICKRSNTRQLQLQYTIYFHEDNQRYKEYGIFKLNKVSENDPT